MLITTEVGNEVGIMCVIFVKYLFVKFIEALHVFIIAGQFY